MAKLTALQVQRAIEPRLYGDGDGLYLQVTSGKRGVAKSRLYRFTIAGRERFMGLGPFPAVSLADARGKAKAARNLRDDGTDPIEARKARRQQAALEAAKSVTFKQAAASYIESHRAGWRSARHAQQWENSL